MLLKTDHDYTVAIVHITTYSMLVNKYFKVISL